MSVAAITFMLAVGSASGQDLGSSNKLFGGGQPTPKAEKRSKSAAKPAAKATVKKATAQKATPKPSVRQPARPADASARTPKPKPGSQPQAGSGDQAKRPPQPDIAIADERYEQLIEKGNTARGRRDLAAAEAAYQEARRLRPGDERPLAGLGNVFAEQLRWDEAERNYRAALKIAPNDPSILVALSYLLIQPVSVPNLSERYGEAEKLARTALAGGRRDALALVLLGAALEAQGMIGPEAENSYRKAIQAAPDLAPAYALLGRYLRRRGNNAEAQSQYARAAALATPATSAFAAEILASDGRFSDVLPMLDRAVKSEPRSAGLHLQRGRALAALGRVVEAEAAYRAAQAAAGSSIQPRLGLADLMIGQKRADRAEEELAAAMRIAAPAEKYEIAMFLERLGDLYLSTRSAADARRAYRQALELAPGRGSIEAKLSSIK